MSKRGKTQGGGCTRCLYPFSNLSKGQLDARVGFHFQNQTPFLFLEFMRRRTVRCLPVYFELRCFCQAVDEDVIRMVHPAPDLKTDVPGFFVHCCEGTRRVQDQTIFAKAPKIIDRSLTEEAGGTRQKSRGI